MPHWSRFKILELASPVLPKPPQTTQHLWEECPKVEEDAAAAEKDSLTPLDLLYAEQFRGYLNRSKMVAFYHGNSSKSFNRRKNFQNARRCKMEIKGYDRVLSDHVLKGSEYEAMMHFTAGSMEDCWFVFSEELEPANILKFNKKAIDLVFLGVAVHGRILDKSQLAKLATMPTIETLHGELSTLLQMPLMKTTQLLSSGTQKLSSQLEQYVKDQSPEKNQQ